MISSLLIVGAGGHGKVVAETAEAMGVWEKIAFLDDRCEELDGTLRWSVLGAVGDAKTLQPEYADAVVAVGDADMRLKLIKQLAVESFHLPVLIHPAAWVSPSVRLGEGSVVFAQAAVNADTHIGLGIIVNTGATVDHDCVIGDGVHICPGAHLGGGVSVGRASWIGIGASVIQQIRIGANVTVGAGAVVVADVSDDVTAAGVPARILSGRKS
ncbi:MAG: acetyltransferase [Mariprofundaceae bacterium]|nr:acetyltransferase [Mariprofundaceae bacterium]